jgi:hypothetical protein
MRYKNRGNFYQMIKILAYYNKEVVKIVIKNTPQNEIKVEIYNMKKTFMKS